MPEEVRVSPSCPQLGQTLLLSESEPPLLTTSPALLHLGHANPSCPQARSKNSTEPPAPSAASTATGAVLEPPRPTGLLGAPQPPRRWQMCNFLCRYPVGRCQAHLGCIGDWGAGGSTGRGQAKAPPLPPVLPKITPCPASRGERGVRAEEGSIAKWDSQAVYQNHPEFVQGAA